jgi:hypothetical protein
MGLFWLTQFLFSGKLNFEYFDDYQYYLKDHLSTIYNYLMIFMGMYLLFYLARSFVHVSSFSQKERNFLSATTFLLIAIFLGKILSLPIQF